MDTDILTARLRLVFGNREEALASIEGMSPSDRAEVSPLWLARVRSSTSPDPWVHGFTIVSRATEVIIGSCGYKGPPDSGDTVEIAYGIHPPYQGQGYATEAARALSTFAFHSGQVKVVRAHTKPENNASTRVLTKCGFECVGEVVDHEKRNSGQLADSMDGGWSRRIPLDSACSRMVPMTVNGGGIMSDEMGTFRTDIEIENPARPGERRALSAVLVDTGAELSWFPAAVLDSLGVPRMKVWRIRQADGTVLERWAGPALVYAGGTVTNDEVVFGERNDMVLLGARSLEGLNLRVDPYRKILVDAGPAPAAAAA